MIQEIFDVIYTVFAVVTVLSMSFLIHRVNRLETALVVALGAVESLVVAKRLASKQGGAL